MQIITILLLIFSVILLFPHMLIPSFVCIYNSNIWILSFFLRKNSYSVSVIAKLCDNFNKKKRQKKIDVTYRQFVHDIWKSRFERCKRTTKWHNNNNNNNRMCEMKVVNKFEYSCMSAPSADETDLACDISDYRVHSRVYICSSMFTIHTTNSV